MWYTVKYHMTHTKDYNMWYATKHGIKGVLACISDSGKNREYFQLVHIFYA